MKPPSQTAAIREHLQSGKTLTPIQALAKYGCFRLAARIHDLKREGLEIITTEVPAKGHSFAKYSIQTN